jgi:hypothetical protein
MPLLASIVPKEIRDDYWLESHFQALRYFHYMKNCENEKIRKLYKTTGSYSPGDVLCHFGTEDQIFTKKRTIRLASYRKIQQAYYIYTGKHLK